MYRCRINDQEVILRLSPKIYKGHNDKDYIYQAILSLEDKLFDFDEGQPFAIATGQDSLIIAEIEQRELTVITVHHIVEKSFVFTI
jgi:hypothetical protein